MRRDARARCARLIEASVICAAMSDDATRCMRHARDEREAARVPHLFPCMMRAQRCLFMRENMMQRVLFESATRRASACAIRAMRHARYALRWLQAYIRSEGAATATCARAPQSDAMSTLRPTRAITRACADAVCVAEMFHGACRADFHCRAHAMRYIAYFDAAIATF